MDAASFIAAYERLREIMHGMLEAARAQQWDHLIALERDCRGEVDRLAALGDAAPALPAPLQQKRAQILRELVAHDAAIRDLTQPWMAQLAQMIGAARNHRQLARSPYYDAPA